MRQQDLIITVDPVVEKVVRKIERPEAAADPAHQLGRDHSPTEAERRVAAALCSDSGPWSPLAVREVTVSALLLQRR
jgi:hypothetical protein